MLKENIRIAITLLCIILYYLLTPYCVGYTVNHLFAVLGWSNIINSTWYLYIFGAFIMCVLDLFPEIKFKLKK